MQKKIATAVTDRTVMMVEIGYHHFIFINTHFSPLQQQFSHFPIVFWKYFLFCFSFQKKRIVFICKCPKVASKCRSGFMGFYIVIYLEKL